MKNIEDILEKVNKLERECYKYLLDRDKELDPYTLEEANALVLVINTDKSLSLYHQTYDNTHTDGFVEI